MMIQPLHSSSAGTVLSLAGVTKRYRRRTSVLIDVNLEVARGQLVQVRGDNGSGKSTLLQLAAGLTRPTDGDVHTHAAVTGFVPDQTGMIGTLTAKAYLTHLASIGGIDKGRARSRIEELQHLFGVKPGLGEKLGALSKGNRQKVLLMQAFLGPTDLLLMDEPTTALDDITVSALHDLVETALNNGTGVLVTTHSNELAGLGRRYYLRDGRLADAVLARPNVTDAELLPAVTVCLSGTTDSLERAARAVAGTSHTNAGAQVEFRVARSSLTRFLLIALDAGCEVVSVTGSRTL
ncbi:ATP-binding cassette domain-containing protein [Microbacterium sp.]|uniref:ATP-binding cassette domain-containing protein n=1 Tax=Microbacterium sp. TaxID=51671 RepID=UPI0035268668